MKVRGEGGGVIQWVALFQGVYGNPLLVTVLTTYV
jgi:hypothetical protein